MCRPLLLLCPIVICWICLVSQSSAQSTWNTATGNWSVDANWSPATAPTSGNTASLIFGGSTVYTATDDIGTFVLNQLQFTNTAGTVTLVGAPTTNGPDFVASSAAVLPSLTLSGAGSGTISGPVIWDANALVSNTGSGTLQFFSETFATGTKQTFVNSGSGSITLSDSVAYTASGSNTGLVLNLANNSATGFLNVGNLGNLNNLTLNIGGTGTVRFSGSAGGDLFSNSTVLNVLAGATFDVNGNGETFGAFSGAGTIKTTVGLSTAATGYYVFSGKITGSGGTVTIGVVGETTVFSGATSDYTGSTSVTAGRLVVSANALSNTAGSLGKATSDVLVGNTSGTSNASLLIDTPGVIIGRNVRIQSGNIGVASVGGLNTSGTVTYSGNIIMGTDTGAAKGFIAYAAPGGTVEFTGSIIRANSAIGSADILTVAGGGTVALRGNNTPGGATGLGAGLSGGTFVNAGMLLLDDTTNNGQKLSPTAVLTLNGGSLSLLGNNSASSTETVTGLTMGSAGGGGRVIVTSGADQNATLILGAITHSAGGTVDFSAVNTGVGVATITTSTANTTAGILGAYATYNKTDWAVNDGSGNIVALATGSYTTTFASGLHTSLTATATALPSGGATTNTLRLTSAGTAVAVTFNSTPGTLTLESGGILIASGTGATSIGTTGTRGTIATGTGELIINQESTAGTLTINSFITGTTLTKSGDGTLVLTGTNTYTGPTFINGGTVSISALANIGTATQSLTIDGGTLTVTSALTSAANTISSTNHPFIIGPAGAIFNFTADVTFQGAGLSGSGTITKTGNATWAVGSNSSSFSGDIIVSAGTLLLSSNQLSKAASITIADGATYNINDDGTGSWGVIAGGRFTISGNGLNNNGAIRLTDQTSAVPFLLDPKSTITSDVVLQNTSRIQVENAATQGSTSKLILSGIVSGSGGIVKSGNGILNLTSRDNSFSGGVTVENGIFGIDLGNDRLPTSTTITLGAGTTSGAFQLNGFSQNIAGLATVGTGTANEVIGGSSTSTSLLDWTVASGTQTYNGTLGGTGVDNNHNNNNLGLIKDGTGVAVLGSANSYNGATTVKQGTLMLGNANALGNGGFSLATSSSGTTVNAGATLDLNGQTNVQEVITLNGSGIGGAGALVNNGSSPSSLGSGVASLSLSSVTTTGWSSSASVSLSAPASGTPATAMALLGITAGSMTVTNGGSGYGLAPTVTVTGGTGAVVIATIGVTSASFTIAGTTTYSVAPTVTLTNGATGVAVLDGTGKVTSISITNPGSAFTGTPTATFSGGAVLVAGTAVTATGNNTHYTVVGLTVVNPGTGFTAPPVITFTGGTGATAVGNDGAFVLNGFAITNNGSGYTSAPTVNVSGGSAVATANLSLVTLASDSSIGGSGDLTVNSVISGGFNLTKVGSNTTTLTATNTYSGNTIVSSGTLQVGVGGAGSIVGAASATSSSFSTTTTSGVTTQNLAVSGQKVITGAPVIAGSGTIGGNVVIGSSLSSVGVLKPGDLAGSSSGVLRIGGSLVVNDGSQIQFNLTHTLANDAGFGSGSVTAKTYVDSIYGGGTGATYTQYWKTASGSYSAIQISGSLTLGSAGAGSNEPTILVTDNNGSYNAGDVFKLLDWASVGTANSIAGGGNFNLINDLVLPDLSSHNLAWDASAFTTYGVLAVVAVAPAPEPGRVILLLIGGMTLVLRRRRVSAASIR